VRGGEAIGVLLCVLVVALPLGLLIGAVILRAAVSFANKCLPQPTSRYYDDDDDDWETEYRPRPRRGSGARAIPEPGMGQAMLIVFVNGIVGFVVSIPINVAMGVGLAGAGGNDPAAQIIASLIQLPIGFLINAGVLTAMLPTTFPRACLVVVFEYLIVIAICLIIAVPLVLLTFAARA
jgi:hypothetical protein